MDWNGKTNGSVLKNENLIRMNAENVNSSQSRNYIYVKTVRLSSATFTVYVHRKG